MIDNDTKGMRELITTTHHAQNLCQNLLPKNDKKN